MSITATLRNNPTPTISLTATFLSCMSGKDEGGAEADADIDVGQMWASRVTDFMWLTILSEFAGTKREYVDRFKHYLQTIDDLSPVSVVDTAADADADADTSAAAAAEREKTRSTILTPCFTDKDILELLRMGEDTSISLSSDTLGITTIRKQNTSSRMRLGIFSRKTTTYLRERTLRDLEVTARRFLQKMPGVTALELSETLTWEVALTKMNDARTALEALKQLKNIGVDDAEVVCELHEITCGLAEHMPPASAPIQ